MATIILAKLLTLLALVLILLDLLHDNQQFVCIVLLDILDAQHLNVYPIVGINIAIYHYLLNFQ